MKPENKLNLEIEKEIGNVVDNIIERIQNDANTFSIAKADKKSPFRNVLSAAMDSSASIEAIKSFIRYQNARKESSPVWKLSVGNKTYAGAVVEQINTLSEDVDEIISNIKEKNQKNQNLIDYVNDKNNEQKIKYKLYLKLIRLYLGYMAREHTALVGEIKDKKQHFNNRESIKKTRSNLNK